jgi:ribosomal protein L35
MRSHILGKKSPKRKRGFRKDRAVVSADVREVKRLLGGR